MNRRVFLSFLLALALAPASDLAPDTRAALDRISADSLRAHVSFLASDALEGRDTPSKGLEVAAEYIAAQFRRAGLEPAGDNGYFQTAHYVVSKPSLDGFELTLENGGEKIVVARDQASVTNSAAVDLSRAPVIKVELAEMAKRAPEEFRGKVLLTAMPDLSQLSGEERERAMAGMLGVREEIARLQPAAAMVVSWRWMRQSMSRLREAAQEQPAVMLVSDPAVRKLYGTLAAGPLAMTASIKVAAAVEEPVVLKNVAATLRGSDPALRDTYVLVSAHYDHVGVRPGGEGDRIMNGANDDASGTASVVELASALAALKERPRRSILFLAYFGEEKGLVGSRYYGRHPLAPLAKTVADINLEQLGRTDDNDGPQIGRASLTGFDYSDVGEQFRKAGEATGVVIFKHEKYSDSFFSRSDNQALADAGVPAHTVCVAYTFPDYHGAGDHWDKLDYANMAKVDRALALGVLLVANNPEAPKWNAANPRTARYVAAAKKLQEERSQKTEVRSQKEEVRSR